jgi:hypothetical protein
MKEHLFRKTQEDIRSYSKTLESVLEIGLEHGIPSADLTLTNALQKTLKLSRDRLKHEALVQDLGYSSLARALKALSQYKQGEIPTDISQLPEVFHRVPAVWLSGKPKSKKEPGFLPIRVRDAERQHRVIAPLLIEAWGLADEDVQDRITRGYLTMSVPAFESELYKYIYDLEPTPLEEEFQSIQPDTDDDMAKSLHLVTHPDVIYDVVKKNED